MTSHHIVHRWAKPFAALAFAAFAAASSPASAALDDHPFLPVDEAFRLHAQLERPNTVRLRWDIAPGYYLYRHRLLVDGEAISDTVTLPDGEPKHDEFFGDVVVYHKALEVAWQLPAAVVESHALSVGYQGCAEAGLCYAPQTRHFTLRPGSGPSAAALEPAGGDIDSVEIAEVAADQELTQWLSERGALWNLLVFFGLGLLLAFTPCVLPMVPILSGLLAQQGDSITTRGGLALSSTYVLAMAATYAIAGVIAALSGANLQAALQHPAVLVSFSAVFVLLALSMFGLYTLRLPSGLNNMLSRVSSRQQGGHLPGAAVMGSLSALVVSPCVAPPLVGALIYIGQTGDAVLGGAALFALGLGMGLPLIVAGTAFGGALPKAGAWMEGIKWLFGFILLGVAIWLLERVLPDLWSMLAWATLGIATAVWLGAFETQRGALGLLRRGLGLSVAVWAALIFLGAAQGSGNPAQPLRAGLHTGAAVPAGHAAFMPVRNLDELQALLARSSQPMLLDIYADWCVTCKVMEEEVFPDPAVRRAMADYQLLRVDVTDNNATDRALQRHFDIVGPPTLLVFAGGREERHRRIVGEISAAELAAKLER